MAELELVPATVEHAHALAETMRAEDRAELLASDGRPPLEVLLNGLQITDNPRTILVDGVVAGMYGVAPISLLGGAGSVWLLTGYAIERAPIAFLRVCRREIGGMLAPYRALGNFIDARYIRAVKWAAWLGFEISEPVPFGVAQLPFFPILMRRQ